MDIIHTFSQLATVVQLTLVIGTLALIFLVACSRKSGENLLLFLRDLRSILRMKVKQSQRKRSYYKNSQRLIQYKREDEGTIILTNGLRRKRKSQISADKSLK